MQKMGSRLCPACKAPEPIAAGAPLWPTGWRCGACGHAVPLSEGFPRYADVSARLPTGYDPDAYDAFVRREDGHFWFEPRNRLLVALADRFFPAAARYLEIGCGTGTVLDAMAASRPWSRVVGAESQPTGLRHARRRLGNRAELVQMDARMIPAREAFDLVGAFDVLEHIHEDAAVLEEIYAALVPGGGLLAAVPQHPALWSAFDDAAHHVRRYRRGELERKLRAAGFEIVFSSSYAAVVLPFMAARRLLSPRRRFLSPRRRHELDIHPALNAGLRCMLNAEVTLTLQGVTWPVGGSRFVAASKARAS
jgi:SAM-dependent methyltransferase